MDDSFNTTDAISVIFDLVRDINNNANINFSVELIRRSLKLIRLESYLMDFDLLKGKFKDKDVRQINPLVLAFIGDAIYEVFVRTYLVDKNREKSVHKLHVEAISFVKAHAQSEIIKKLEEDLTEEEIYFFKRGRNSKSGTLPKNADVQEYRFATGFESLMGYLYLTEQNERLNYLLNKIAHIHENGGI